MNLRTGIVCEGGGMRGVFTSGVLQAFMENNFMADELVGVSAGASNGISYVSGQQHRGYRTNVDYAGDKRYISKRNYLKTKSLFGMDFIFGEIPDKLDPFDYEAFHASHCDYYAGATDVNTGEITFFGKEDMTPGLIAMRASCSVPIFSPIVYYKGNQYLDGGVADPIPINKALQNGCERLIVILTRERGYRKTSQSFSFIYKNVYKKYPNMIKAIENRHLVYNNTLDQLERLEADGTVLVIAPSEPLTVDRFGKDRDKLIEAYNAGYARGTDFLQKI